MFSHPRKHPSHFINREEKDYQELINGLIEKYKIDIDNIDHLEYWNLQNQRCCIPCLGGKEIEGTNYRVPSGVLAMMKIASEKENYKSYNDFMDAIESIKTNRWNYHPFALFKRSETTTLLYQNKENRMLKTGTQYTTR